MHSRFLFDADFSPPQAHGEANQNVELVTKSERERAEYERGFQDGEAAASESFNQNILALLERIAIALDDIRLSGETRLRDGEHRLITGVIQLARHFAVNLDPVEILTKPQFGLRPILETLARESNIAIVLAPDDAASIRTHLEHLPFTITTLNEDDAMNAGHFEIIWPDGGMIFDRKRLEDTYTTIASHYLAS